MAISAARDTARVAQSLAQAGTESHKHDIGYWVERGKRLDFASGRRVQAAGSFEHLPEIVDTGSAPVSHTAAAPAEAAVILAVSKRAGKPRRTRVPARGLHLQGGRRSHLLRKRR